MKNIIQNAIFYRNVDGDEFSFDICIFKHD